MPFSPLWFPVGFGVISAVPYDLLWALNDKKWSIVDCILSFFLRQSAACRVVCPRMPREKELLVIFHDCKSVSGAARSSGQHRSPAFFLFVPASRQLLGPLTYDRALYLPISLRTWRCRRLSFGFFFFFFDPGRMETLRRPLSKRRLAGRSRPSLIT